MDSVLLQHLAVFAKSNDCTDIDEAVEWLRRTYKMHQRVQMRALRLKTERAIQALRAQPRAAAEVKLQV